MTCPRVAERFDDHAPQFVGKLGQSLVAVRISHTPSIVPLCGTPIRKVELPHHSAAPVECKR
jgi:hypothetical protein